MEVESYHQQEFAMSIIVLKFPEVKVYAERPAKCPSRLPMQMKVRSPTPSGLTDPKPGCWSPGRVHAKSIVAIRMEWAFWFPGKFANQF